MLEDCFDSIVVIARMGRVTGLIPVSHGLLAYLKPQQQIKRSQDST